MKGYTAYFYTVEDDDTPSMDLDLEAYEEVSIKAVAKSAAEYWDEHYANEQPLLRQIEIVHKNKSLGIFPTIEE